MLRPSSDSGPQRLLRVGVLAMVCALGGAVDLVNNSFAQWVARMASFPEEEHQTAKDRDTGVAAAQPARKGGLRPVVASGQDTHVPIRSATVPAAVPHVPATHRSLTGAGIFQHC